MTPRWVYSAGFERALRWLAVATTAGMFAVLVMGATVTSTGSSEGCGRSWPLCHGQFIPEFAVATLIEFGHRAVTGVEGLLVVALAVGVWLRWRARLEAKVLAPVMLGFLFLQAGLGAWAVLYPQTAAALALHFGISLIAFASCLLTTTFLFDLDGREVVRDQGVPAGFRRAVFGSLAYLYVVVYLGAYVRHAHYELACVDWPLCNGQVVPVNDLWGPTGVAFVHRLAALGAVLLLGWLAVWGSRLRTSRPDLAWGTAAAWALVVLQALSGGLVVLTRVSLFSALAHAGVMSLLFGALAYVAMQTLARPRVAEPTEAHRAKAARRTAAAPG